MSFMGRLRYAPVALYSFLAGCSVHPLPEDFSRSDTFQIVESVRCEARHYLVQQALDTLEKSPDRYTQGVAQRLRSGQLTFLEADALPIAATAKEHLDRFRHAGLAYEFKFTITELDKAIGNAALKMPFLTGALTIALKAGEEKTRTSDRTVKLSDAFGTLVTEREEKCRGYHPGGSNWIYPITGEIGLEETIGTFIRLVNDNTKPVDTFVDDLAFTTKKYAQVKPSIELSKLDANQLRLASGDIDLNGDRTDVHKVKISISDLRQLPPVLDTKRIKLADDVTLDIKVPKPSFPVRRVSSQRNFSVSPQEDATIRRKALDALDLYTVQQNLDVLRRLDGSIGQ